MQEKNAMLIPETGCPAGTQMNILRCIDSYTWCEKVVE